MGSGLLCGRVGSGQTPPRVDVPSFCGSPSAFESQVADLQHSESAHLTVSEVVILAQSDGSYQLTLVSPEGVRVITDPDCATLFRTAVVIAAALSRPDAKPAVGQPAEEPSDDSEARASTSGAPRATVGGGESRLSAAPRARPGPESSSGVTSLSLLPLTDEQRPKARGLAFQLGGGGGVFMGITPKPRLGVEVLTGVSGNQWGTHVALRLLPPQSAVTQGNLGLRQTVLGARLSLSHREPAWLRVSAGLSAYWILASGIGVAQSQSDQVGFFAPELELAAVVFDEGRVQGEVGLQGRVGLTQPRFEVSPSTTVYEVPRWGGAGLFRIIWGAE